MPCVCGQKVDRPQPKVQCAECQEFFHLDCVGLLQAVVDFLLSSDKPYLCKTCSADRRSAIRCQTLSVLSAETKNKNHDDTNVHNNKQQITLLVVVKELAALRTENSRILSAVNALREEKKQTMQKSDDLLAEIRTLHSKLEAKDVALSTLTSEIYSRIASTVDSLNLQHNKPTIYNVDALVLVDNEPMSTGHSRKLEPHYKGPFIITASLGNDRYVVEDLPGSHRKQRHYSSVYASDKLKLWCNLPPCDDIETDEDETTGESTEPERGRTSMSGEAECKKTL